MDWLVNLRAFTWEFRVRVWGLLPVWNKIILTLMIYFSFMPFHTYPATVTENGNLNRAHLEPITLQPTS